MSPAESQPRIVLAVTGGIAAYKACELVRWLRQRGASVRVAMSRAATRFVQPLTFAALSGNRVVDDLFADPYPQHIAHIRWAESCDLFCVAPATAGFLARMAHGIADDFPSTLHLAVRSPIVVAPAMEDDMFRHPAVVRNLRTLRSRGVVIVGPASGPLASGRVGPGRMAEPHEIADTAFRIVDGPEVRRWLQGKRVVVTVGPTWEAIDPMRVLTNRSTGRMGMTLAAEALLAGAEVVVVRGPCAIPAPAGARVCPVTSALEMAETTIAEAARADVVVMAAAVADFRPRTVAGHKLHKQDFDELQLELEPTTDILAALARQATRPVLVGFAAETEDVVARAREKLRRKGADLIVANRIGVPGSGFGSEDNEVTILDAGGGEREVPRASKRLVAAEVLESLRAFMQERGDV